MNNPKQKKENLNKLALKEFWIESENNGGEGFSLFDISSNFSINQLKGYLSDFCKKGWCCSNDCEAYYDAFFTEEGKSMIMSNSLYRSFLWSIGNN